VLGRQKFRRWLTHAEAVRLIAGLRRIAEVINDPPTDPTPRTRDPGDEFVVALAVAADVEVLVSGDPHLLEAEDVDIPVVTPSAFLARLDTSV
jgi:predicted nucleic acid-binding protein